MRFAGAVLGAAVLAAPSQVAAIALWPEGPVRMGVSTALGYTHYQATELNEVLQLLENLTRETAGLNPYRVSGFSGHPATQLSVSVQKGPWRLGLETEFWTQTFAQADVPFDLSDNERTTRITCADLIHGDPTSLAGCIQAKESFLFLPITLQVSWMPRWTPWLRAGVGYGLGFLGGKASLELATVYHGEGASSPDKIRFDIEPDPLINPVQKAFLVAEWTPKSWFGLESRLGWRRSRAGGFTLKNPTGTSKIFEAAFAKPQDGDQMWVRWPATTPDARALWIGSREAALANASRYGHQLVQGDFDGWFAALTMNLQWSLP